MNIALLVVSDMYQDRMIASYMAVMWHFLSIGEEAILKLRQYQSPYPGGCGLIQRGLVRPYFHTYLEQFWLR